MYSGPQDNVLCVAPSDGGADEGALLSQLYSVLKDADCLDEIDKALGIPALVGQVRAHTPSLILLLLQLAFSLPLTPSLFPSSCLIPSLSVSPSSPRLYNTQIINS